MCDEACRVYAGRPAFGNYGSLLSFGQLDEKARAFAAWLQHACGLQPGERVALMMPNVLAYPVALLGALRAGAVVVNTNPLYTPRELDHQLNDSGARVVVAFENSLGVLEAVRASTSVEHVVVVRIGDLMSRPKAFLFNRFSRRRAPAPIPKVEGALRFLDAVTAGRELPFRAPRIGGDDLAFLQYTGGTTGRSKGAMLTHRNIVANIAQMVAWFGDHAEPGKEIVVTALPLYHIYALTANCFAFLTQGGMNYLITDPRDVGSFVKELRRVPFTAITGVNTLFNMLIQHDGFESVDFGALKYASGGGMAVQRSVAERWQAITGHVIAEGYGLTESSPVVTANRFDLETFTGSIGLPVPSTDVRILDEDGRELGFDVPGELCVRGPQVMRGYWNNPEDTAAVLDADGWLRTGDIATMDAQGYLRIVDRKKDLILVSGFNVYPNEIEDVAVSHPGVVEACAIGLPNAKSTESVKLAAVRSDPALTAEALVEWCRERLAAYKVPRDVEFVDELPKSNVGKILRREVRERYGRP